MSSHVYHRDRATCRVEPSLHASPDVVLDAVIRSHRGIEEAWLVDLRSHGGCIVIRCKPGVADEALQRASREASLSSSANAPVSVRIGTAEDVEIIARGLP